MNKIKAGEGTLVIQKVTLEDLDIGTGVVRQVRGGEFVTRTQINAANLPFDETRTLAQRLEGISADLSNVESLLAEAKENTKSADIAKKAAEIIERNCLALRADILAEKDNVANLVRQVSANKREIDLSIQSITQQLKTAVSRADEIVSKYDDVVRLHRLVTDMFAEIERKETEVSKFHSTINKAVCEAKKLLQEAMTFKAKVEEVLNELPQFYIAKEEITSKIARFSLRVDEVSDKLDRLLADRNLIEKYYSAMVDLGKQSTALAECMAFSKDYSFLSLYFDDDSRAIVRYTGDIVNAFLNERGELVVEHQEDVKLVRNDNGTITIEQDIDCTGSSHTNSQSLKLVDANNVELAVL